MLGSAGAPVLYVALAALLGLAIHREAAWAWLAIGAGAPFSAAQSIISSRNTQRWCWTAHC